MRARNVKGLDPDGTLAENAQRIVAVRLDELCGFGPEALDPRRVEALHDMRIAAKRLRYVLELTRPALGSSAPRGARTAQRLQDLLGEIHDCDVMLPRLRRHTGVEGLAAHIAGRREVLFTQFTREWARLESRAFAQELLAGLSPDPPAPAGPTDGAAP